METLPVLQEQTISLEAPSAIAATAAIGEDLQFANALKELEAVGFTRGKQNLRMLKQVNGNSEVVREYLMARRKLRDTVKQRKREAKNLRNESRRKERPLLSSSSGIQKRKQKHFGRKEEEFAMDEEQKQVNKSEEDKSSEGASTASSASIHLVRRMNRSWLVAAQGIEIPESDTDRPLHVEAVGDGQEGASYPLDLSTLRLIKVRSRGFAVIVKVVGLYNGRRLAHLTVGFWKPENFASAEAACNSLLSSTS